MKVVKRMVIRCGEEGGFEGDEIVLNKKTGTWKSFDTWLWTLRLGVIHG